jgi:hypothetical protein
VFGPTPVATSLYLLGTDLEAERLAASLCTPGHETIPAIALPNACGVLVRAMGATASMVRKALLTALACYTATYPSS